MLSFEMSLLISRCFPTFIKTADFYSVFVSLIDSCVGLIIGYNFDSFESCVYTNLFKAYMPHNINTSNCLYMAAY